MNKKGNVVTDMITWGVWLFVIALVAVIGVMVANQVNDKLQVSALDTEAKDNLQGTTERYDNTLDNMFFMAFVLLWIFVFLASFMLNSHPVFFAVMLFLVTFVFIVIAILSNTFESLITGSLNEYALMLPKTMFILNHYLELGLAVAFSTALGLYAKA